MSDRPPRNPLAPADQPAGLTRLDHAQLVRAVLDMRDRCDELLGVLLPTAAADAADGECPHLPADVVDDSTMDEELYRCRRCGATSDVPFPSFLPDLPTPE